MQIELNDRIKDYIITRINSDISDNDNLRVSIDEEEKSEIDLIHAIYQEKRMSANNERKQLIEFINENNLCKCKECNKYFFKSDYTIREETKQEWDCVFEGIINGGENEYQMSDKVYTYLTCPNCMKEWLSDVRVKRHFGETVGRDRAK